MNNYSSLKQQNKRGLQTAVAILSLCVLLTTTLLVGQLMEFAARDHQHYIPLTRSRGGTHVQVGQRQEDGSIRYTAMGPRPANGVLLTAFPNFQVYDDNTVWSTQTDVEIFSIHYDNATGETTVRSQDGTKVLAPGTGNTYAFTLENTGNVPLQYTLEMDAWFSDTEYPIPVVVTVTDYHGDYLLGSDGEMVDVLRLSEVQEEGTIDAGYLQPYVLQWEWPFEQDDTYDTMLGNLAVDHDITLTVEIRTTASWYPHEDPGGLPPQTGDESDLMFYSIAMVASLAGLLLLLTIQQKKRENNYD